MKKMTNFLKISLGCGLMMAASLHAAPGDKNPVGYLTHRLTQAYKTALRLQGWESVEAVHRLRKVATAAKPRSPNTQRLACKFLEKAAHGGNHLAVYAVYELLKKALGQPEIPVQNPFFQYALLGSLDQQGRPRPEVMEQWRNKALDHGYLPLFWEKAKQDGPHVSTYYPAQVSDKIFWSEKILQHPLNIPPLYRPLYKKFYFAKAKALNMIHSNELYNDHIRECELLFQIPEAINQAAGAARSSSLNNLDKKDQLFWPSHWLGYLSKLYLSGYKNSLSHIEIKPDLGKAEILLHQAAQVSHDFCSIHVLEAPEIPLEDKIRLVRAYYGERAKINNDTLDYDIGKELDSALGKFYCELKNNPGGETRGILEEILRLRTTYLPPDDGYSKWVRNALTIESFKTE